ncbi:per [Symbiodinium pilosum]|uniref:Per protein n=1 Tax=Symbiodinium pilosum TaxID=2952 RepID=A0A812VQM6_SYMPI|nr:per [Symbiodinium pilosum]
MGDLSAQAFPVNTPKFWGNEKDLLAKCIETGWISSEGPSVKDFESKLSARCQRRHGIACANGTAALDIAVQALGLGQGDEARALHLSRKTQVQETKQLKINPKSTPLGFKCSQVV